MVFTNNCEVEGTCVQSTQQLGKQAQHGKSKIPYLLDIKRLPNTVQHRTTYTNNDKQLAGFMRIIQTLKVTITIVLQFP